MRVELTPPAELFPFRSRWFDAGGKRMHYVDEGSGTPILMCHGNPTWSFLYRKVILALRDRYRCVAMDYPGFGLSDRPERYGYTPAEHATLVGALVDSLGLEGFIVMGQDWGGPIGMQVATERADRVAGLVFMNTWFWPADLRFTAFSLVMSSPPLRSRILDRNFFVESIMPRSVATPLEPAVMDQYRRAQPTREARRGVAEFPRQIRAARPWLARLAERAPVALRGKPMLLIWGMKDPGFGSRSIVDRWKASFPDAEVVMLPAASHYIQEDAPEEIAAAVRRRFASL
ncbi:MAG TPA: alpha/beta fold hydrolase [Candidatus Dormibacteraeota bacterium]|jgi:haloalkane dehalogenase|nr:alpha/beta fold hydrolase [Candidatus Dormibacteraeota bacterium]